MNKITKILTAVAFVLLLGAIDASAQTVEIDNYMPAAYSYCYNAQLYSQGNTDAANNNPAVTYRIATYRLELLTQAFSANGRISGLEAGIKARTGIDCSGITFVNEIPDWYPQLEHAIT